MGKHEIYRKEQNTWNYFLVLLTSLKCKENVKYNWNCKQVRIYLLCYKILYLFLELENKHSVGFASHHLSIERKSKKCWQEITTFGSVN